MTMGEGFRRNTRASTGQIDIASLKLGLIELKPTRQPTKIEIIRQLMDEIELMLEVGVTYSDIARFLKEHGVDVTEASLKSTLSKVRKEKKTENLGGNDSTQEDATAALDGKGSDAPNSEAIANK